jgi:hypothetical protein
MGSIPIIEDRESSRVIGCSVPDEEAEDFHDFNE